MDLRVIFNEDCNAKYKMLAAEFEIQLGIQMVIHLQYILLETFHQIFDV